MHHTKVTMFLLLGLFLSIAVLGVTKKIPYIYPAQCVGCGDCYRICPVKDKAIAMHRGKAVILVDKCIACDRCVWICSYGACRR